MAHLAINPENIYLMPDGKWKLAGFSNNQSLNTNSFVPYETKQHSDMSYLAPEMVISEKCGYVSDTFSIMLLVLNLVKIANNKK
jgi:serine/threonine protein kinase